LRGGGEAASALTLRGASVFPYPQDMGLRSWWRRFQSHEDAKAIERAQELALESPEERKLYQADMEGMEADLKAGERMYDTPDEAERLAEDE
jgi:hypothetical protein